ncbi:hypothetical protein EAF04_003771 [Stromatinia cepivora]|nr:hypothetical protein EAF04_003771 [Stromatinia cepivora]
MDFTTTGNLCKTARCPIALCEYSTIGFETLELEINHVETQHEIIPHNLVSDYPPTEVEELDSIDEMMEQSTWSWNEELSVHSESHKTRPESDGYLDDDNFPSDLTSLVTEDFHQIGDMRAEIANAPNQCSPVSAESGSSSTSQSTGRTKALHSSVNSLSLVHSNTPNKKHNRPDDGPSDDEGTNDPKRPRSGSSQSGLKKKAFACPFYKKMPHIYSTKPDSCRKFLTCMGLGYSIFRRMQDHLDAVHRTFQCGRCSTILSSPDGLLALRRSEPPRDPQSANPKEGMDEGQ